jgi:PKD repeat protein
MRNRVVLASLVGLALLTLASCVYVLNLSPVASFTALPALGTTPLDVTLDATASHDPDGTIASYLWNFGDGQTASASTFPFTHQFTVQSNSETFTIILTVTDNQGAAATAVQNVTVNPAP